MFTSFMQRTPDERLVAMFIFDNYYLAVTQALSVSRRKGWYTEVRETVENGVEIIVWRSDELSQTDGETGTIEDGG